MMKLGINVDHVATLRQARGGKEPSPTAAALMAQEAGADNITVHLREDRRHIQDHDVFALKEILTIPINFEMAATPAMVDIALQLKPAMCCLVPEKRQELTTEGGLDIIAAQSTIKKVCEKLSAQDIHVSLFIDADSAQIQAAAACGAQAIELHTGKYAEASNAAEQALCLKQLQDAAKFASELGLEVHAGHGLNYYNVLPVAQIPTVEALMIGHAIIAHAVFVGLPQAIYEMKALLMQKGNNT